ncbi:efflux RND transporter periplasmic adaptor subunit [Pseudoxanthomonas suwonensis]|uniref:efflux RND transporter periplasmic adaptor subunit n=1 Tax=Pseudoxanthomonas suwonensis TaxID=314722 RepID=UPI00138F41A3|nr:efflux RND transporter periplasmic adaptor subunit [Pseudoxanthomonas suwonensis]KAF1705728.1 efflux transporter periplasmic adaptor subunit [Pseudoxanthomonas suwonensis]
MQGRVRYGVLAAIVAIALAGCGNGDEAPQAARPVWVVQPQPAGGSAGLAFPGEVRAREESPLAFRIGGELVARRVDAGARVAEGQALAELDPGDQALQARAARAQYAAAEAERVRLKGELDRYAQLVGQQLVSRSAYEAQEAAYKAAAGQADAARAQWEVTRNQSAYTTLRAPHAGVIASRQAEVGQVVAAGQTIFMLAADGGREVAIDLPEDRIGQFKVGDPAEVELWSRPGQRLPARIRELAPAADPQTRSYAVRVALDAAVAGDVALGQSARVFLGRGDAGAGLQVPLSALQQGADGKPVVWAVREGKAVPVPVEHGPLGSESVDVRGGLRAGDWVVAAGGHLLREGEEVVPVDRANRPVAAAAAKPKAD